MSLASPTKQEQGQIMQLGEPPDPGQIGWWQLVIVGGVAILGWFGGWMRGIYLGAENVLERVRNLEEKEKILQITSGQHEARLEKIDYAIAAVSDSIRTLAAKETNDMADLKIKIAGLLTSDQFHARMLEFMKVLHQNGHPLD